MDLRDFIKDYPGYDFFDQKKDQQEAFQIFEMIPMRLPGFKLIYDRTPEFSALLQAQAEKFLTFVYKIDHKLQGFASLSWGPRYLNGEKKTVSYIGDLRMKPVRPIISSWKSFYPSLLKNAEKILGIDYHLTAILSDNKLAIRSLVEGKKNPFKYHFLNEITMVNIIGKKPLKILPRPKAKFKKVALNDSKIADILKFMDQREKEKIFGFCLLDSEWNRRLKHWPKLSDAKVFVFENEKGIQATCIPWSVSEIKRMKVTDMSKWLKASLLLPRLLGFSLPVEGEPLKVPYLTHLYFSPETTVEEKATYLAFFLSEAKNEIWAMDAHFITFADSWGIHKTPLFKKYWLQTTTVNIYAVTHENRTIPDSFKGRDIGFEMSLA